MSKEEYEKEFRAGFKAEMVGKVQMAPAFSGDFVTFYKEREKFIPQQRRNIMHLKKNVAKLKEKDVELQKKYDQVHREEIF